MVVKVRSFTGVGIRFQIKVSVLLFIVFLVLANVVGLWASPEVQASMVVENPTTFSDDNWVGLGGLPGASGEIRAMVTDEAGTIYVGGTFTIIDDVKVNAIAQWDGSSWLPLGVFRNPVGIQRGLHPEFIRWIFSSNKIL